MSPKNTIKMVSQPENLKIKLFEHQLVSIYNMEKLEREKIVENDNYIKETKLGINSDITGFGKTLAMLGLIVRDKMTWELYTPFVVEKIDSISLGIITNRKINRYKKLSANLILVSPSILSQWKNEIKNTNLKMECICSRKDIDLIDITNCDIVLVIPSMYNNLVKSYSKYAWKRFIFDEPGHMRVPSMKEVVAGFYWFVTATPNSISIFHRNCRGSFIKNIIGESWVDFETQFENMIIKNDIKFVKQSFSMPKTYNYYYKCYQPLLKVINGIADPVINNMIEADNIEDVITLLGGKKTRNIIKLIKDKKLLEIDIINDKIKIYEKRNDNNNIKISENKKKRINNQLNELDKRFEEMLEGSCCICMEKLHKPVLEKSCQNIFCGKCLIKWINVNNSCPICREKISIEDIIYLDNTENKNENLKNENENENQNVTKLQRIVEILLKNKDKKFIVFSNYNNTFKPICKILDENSINFSLIKGNNQQRETNIKGYKYGNTQVIFLNSNFNGAGINLQETTDIIFYHKISDNMKEQILGRAKRIGSENILSVHYLEANI
jgi:hypothetical protein